jgi:hypothetical protein
VWKLELEPALRSPSKINL